MIAERIVLVHLRSGRLVGPALAAFGFLLAVSLAVPAPAQAFSLNPVDWFRDIISWVFGDVDELGKDLVRVLLAVPNLTDHGAFPKLNAYREYVQGGAGALLFVSLVISSLRFWMSGLSSSSGGDAYAAVEGFKRVAGAVGMLLLFLPAFEAATRTTNLLTSALIVNEHVGGGLSGSAGPFAIFVGLGSLITGGGLAMILGIVVLLAAVVLLLVKVIVTALLMVLYAGAPLAIGAWPIEEASFLLKALLGAILGILLFPIIWALVFAVFTLVTPDALFGSATGDFLKGFLGPLIALAMLVIAFVLPFAVMRMAMQTGLMPSPIQAARSLLLIRRLAH